MVESKTTTKKAQLFLDEIFNRTGTSASRTYMIPGNHDIDRDYVEPEFPLWALMLDCARVKIP